MKRVEASSEALVFHLNGGERLLLRKALQLYPMVPASHHRVSRGAVCSVIIESQHILDEAMAEQRLCYKRKIDALFRPGGCLKKTPEGYHLILSAADCEWLLQVLNDVRVGCWLELGSPEEGQEPTPPSSSRGMRLKLIMDACAYFQYHMIKG